MEPGKFGPFLRDLRTRRGLTQEQVAEALHVSGAAVSKWENGKCLPDLTKLETLAEILHVGMLDLMQCGAAGAPPAARQAPADTPSGPAERSRRQQVRGVASCGKHRGDCLNAVFQVVAPGIGGAGAVLGFKQVLQLRAALCKGLVTRGGKICFFQRQAALARYLHYHVAGHTAYMVGHLHAQQNERPLRFACFA